MRVTPHPAPAGQRRSLRSPSAIAAARPTTISELRRATEQHRSGRPEPQRLGTSMRRAWLTVVASLAFVLVGTTPTIAHGQQPDSKAVVDTATSPDQLTLRRPPALPSPMEGITVTPEQRAAMQASWARVQAQWNATIARVRAGEPLTREERATLRRLSEEHNARVVEILTPEQRQRLEANLTHLRELTSGPRRGEGE